MISFKTLRSLCLDFIVFFIPAALLWLVFPKVLGIFLPFILGYAIYLTANPLNRRLKRIVPPSLSAFLSISVISLVLFFLLRIIFSHLISEIALFTRSNSFYKDAVPFISRKINTYSSGRWGEIFSGLFDSFHTQLSEILLKISGWAINFAKNIPVLLITVFTTLFTAFFLLKDNIRFYDGAKNFFGNDFCNKFFHYPINQGITSQRYFHLSQGSAYNRKYYFYRSFPWIQLSWAEIYSLAGVFHGNCRCFPHSRNWNGACTSLCFLFLNGQQCNGLGTSGTVWCRNSGKTALRAENYRKQARNTPSALNFFYLRRNEALWFLGDFPRSCGGNSCKKPYSGKKSLIFLQKIRTFVCIFFCYVL